MRIASPCLTQVLEVQRARRSGHLLARRPLFSPSVVHKRCLRQYRVIGPVVVPYQHENKVATSRLYRGSFVRRITQNARPASKSGVDASTYTEQTHSNIRNEKDIKSWVTRLNRCLSIHLGSSPTTKHNTDRATPKQDLAEVRSILQRAKDETGVDLFLWMIENGRQKAVTKALNLLVTASVANVRKPPSNSPSNVAWPDELFKDLDCSPVEVNGLQHNSRESAGYEHGFTNNPFSHDQAQQRFDMLDLVWTSLGDMVIQATHRNELGSQLIMSVVLLVLAHIHNQGIMPHDFYAYQSTVNSAYVQKPPVLHLVSSRIMTALSDATWRKQQDDAIAKAAKMGMTLKEISKSVPGGRFRLKVRPLDPEIWIELILWCCVEGGHASAAISIIRALSMQSENPWFAIRWHPNALTSQPRVHVDWDRVKTRHGGTVGLIEGYSREKPFADVPPRTISVEVVLATIDMLLNTCDLGSDSDANTLPLHTTQEFIQDAIAFLEPHDLTPDYFDYLEHRLVALGAFDNTAFSTRLHEWWLSSQQIRDLEKITDSKGFAQNLELDSIKAHTQLHAGIQHQALDVLIRSGNIHSALEVFNQIQERVDKSKVSSITQFLQTHPEPNKAFFSARPFKHRLEYAESHGQLPYNKIAALINLVSDTKLIGFGQWLLYADDLDGVMVPESAYGLPCLTESLLRFATITKDDALFSKLFTTRFVSKQTLKPTVRQMRALCNAELTFLDFASARETLSKLKMAKGGGYHIDNIVHLATVILQLEKAPFESESKQSRSTSLSEAWQLMQDLLRGKYDSLRSDFTLRQKMRFNQQMSHTLRIFAHFGQSMLRDIAEQHVTRFRSGNQVSLQTKHFNPLLEAAVHTGGSVGGKWLWRLFCQKTGILDETNNPESSISSVPVRKVIPQFTQTGKQESKTQDRNIMALENPFFPPSPTNTLGWQLLKPAVVTVPNMKSLRIIVRAAAEEKRGRKARNQPYKVQNQVILWALDIFKSFGVTTRGLLEQEIQEPPSALDEEILEQMQEKSPHRISARETLEQPVSVLWSPSMMLKPSENA